VRLSVDVGICGVGRHTFPSSVFLSVCPHRLTGEDVRLQSVMIIMY
jgi:hypothetical protein